MARAVSELFERNRLETVFDDHARAFVNLPDIVVLVYADRVSEGVGAIVPSPFLNEFGVLIELPTTEIFGQQQRGRIEHVARGEELAVRL
jgi:hypothetical protein